VTHPRIAIAAALAAGLATGVGGQEAERSFDWRTGYTLYGTPGLIDMPTATSAREGEIATTLSGFAIQQRLSFSFQVTDRLSGSFRYAYFDELGPARTGDTYDRSFDLQYRLVDEDPDGWRPAMALGLRDFLGTGRYSGEYLVATKAVSDRLRVTGGIGWGRLGSYNGFDNPLGRDDRPAFTPGDTGGKVNLDQFFAGPAAFFAGAEYQIIPRLTLVGEYSSDAYEAEAENGSFDRDVPVNVGLRWRYRPWAELSAHVLHGSEIGLSGTFILNPQDRPFAGGLDPAPPPVVPASAVHWDNLQGAPSLEARVAAALTGEGLVLQGIEQRGTTLRVRFDNSTYRAEAQAIGRAARVLTATAPAGIETFVLEPARQGIPLAGVTLRRADLERLENTADAADALYARATIGDAGPRAGLTPVAAPAPALQWGLAPYMEISLFDGDNPARADGGIEATGRYRLAPNVSVNGTLRYRLFGDRSEAAISPSTLPPVRREVNLYGADGGVMLERLTLDWYARPGQDLYARVSLGYLERMYGGVSTEVLWQPVDSRLALGAEVNYAVQRDRDLGLDFDDYDIVTGHLSAYYDFGNGFQGQVDAGRYLAGDWGATFRLERAFDNGWRLGGYFTLTDVSADDFGEGSFDKGIVLTIPTDWVIGRPTRSERAVNLASLTRDGGARLEVDGRLYDVVRDAHGEALTDGWGRVWR